MPENSHTYCRSVGSTAPGLDGDDRDELWVYDPEMNVIDHVRFGEAHTGRSFTYSPDTGVFGVLSTVGITLVAATVIGLYIGLKLDGWLGTSPWLTALFLVLGLFAGFKNLFIYVKKSEETNDDSDKKEQK